jgi:hypothetical protein
LNFIEGLLHYKYNPKYEGWLILFYDIIYITLVQRVMQE